MEEMKYDMLECVRTFFEGKSFVAEHLDEDDVEAFKKRKHLPDDYDFETSGNDLIKNSDDIYIVKSCEYAAILFSRNEARRRAEWIMDRIGTNDEDIKLYMHAKSKSFFDFAVTITRIFKENNIITMRCISIVTFCDLFGRLKKDMSYA